MRVAFFGQTGPYAPPALRELVPHQRGFQLVGVVEGLKRGGGGPVFELCRPAPGPLPEGERLVDLAVAAGLPVLRTNEVNARRAVQLCESWSLDLIVTVGFDRLFSVELLATARRGGINAHPSALPRLRGPAPIFWALRRGLRELTVTLHALDRHEDHGPIHAQRAFPLPRRVTGDWIYDQAGRLAGQMLAELLPRAASGPLPSVPQDDAAADRAPRPVAEDLEVVPLEWGCEHLVDFACGAPFFRAPWLRLGPDTFHVRTGLRAEPGRQLPAQYVLQGEVLVVQCRDGAAHLEIQI